MKRNLITFFWILLAWSLIALYQFADSYVTLLRYGAIDAEYDVARELGSIGLSMLLGGSAGAICIVFVWVKWLRTLNFRLAALLIVLCYTVIYLSVALISAVNYKNASPENALQVAENGGVLLSILSPASLPNFLFWLGVMLATMFLLFVRDRFGPGMLGPYLFGKYFKPMSEQRVVMFLDLKDSTHIAESLGAERYFTFLNKVFHVVTSSILDARGQIYQYVGDEIVITWDRKDAAKDANCVRCFLNIQSVLLENAAMFESAFGHTPFFKAGLNAGNVVAGEVGVIKREIVYSGDVLNTAARIRGLCNELNHDLLLSQSVKEIVEVHGQGIRFDELGTFEIRGRSEPVNVYASVV